MATTQFKDYSIEDLESQYQSSMERLNNAYKARVIIWAIVLIFTWWAASLEPGNSTNFMMLVLFIIFPAHLLIKENVGRTIQMYEKVVEEIEQEFIYRKYRLPDEIHRSWLGGH